ncbi:MAG: sigma-70 family RNA polymerase sigma factor [Bacteroidota bacterium]
MSFIKNISPQNLSDRELVLQYKQSGDLNVLGDLYQRYMELVYGVCLKYLKEPETAKDAVMAVFEELVSKLRKHDVDNFKGWLYMLAKNHCLMQLRSSKNIHFREFDAGHVQLTEDVHLNGVMEKEEHFDKLNGCMQTLSEEQRATVTLFYLQNKCYNEISEITGFEWSKVRSLIQNGRRNLKICMEQKMSNTENE